MELYYQWLFVKNIKKIIRIKKIIEKDDLEFYENEEIEKLNLDFLINFIYDNEFILDDSRHQEYTLHSLETIFIIVIFALLANCNTYKEIELFIGIHYEWLIRKLKYLTLVEVNKKIVNGDIFIKYNNIKFNKQKNFNTFIDLLEKGYIKLTFKHGIFRSGKKLGKIHDRGTSFSIEEKNINKLFEYIE